MNLLPPVGDILAFIGTTAVLFILPGPSAFFAISRALDLGRRRALIAVAGNALGILPAVALVALGVGAAVVRFPILLLIVRLVGAGFLGYLAVSALRHARAPIQLTTAAAGTARLLVDGFLVGVTNPKAVVILLAILPQFVDPAGAPVSAQLGFLGLLSILLGGTADACWSLLAGTARTLFTRSIRALTVLRVAGGLIMFALAGVLAADAIVGT